MKNLKKKDINFLKLFTAYQIAELVICFIFNYYITLAYTRPVNVGEVVDLAYTIKNFMYAPGLAIQYGIVIVIWFISVLMNIKYLKVIKIALYLSVDMIIPLAIPMFLFIGFSYVKGFADVGVSRFAHFVYWMLGFALLIVCSKVAFFKFYEKRFVPQEELPNAKTMEKEYIADNDV